MRQSFGRRIGLGSAVGQERVCKKYGAEFLVPDLDAVCGWGQGLEAGRYPLNGLRHEQAGQTSGWYFWSGENLPSDDDFFQPVCLGHAVERVPELKPFLGLVPGWRFLVAPDWEDVWRDPNLIPTVPMSVVKNI